MINLVKVISTSLDDAKRRIIKFSRFGKSDIQDVPQASPFGDETRAHRRLAPPGNARRVQFVAWEASQGHVPPAAAECDLLGPISQVATITVQ